MSKRLTSVSSRLFFHRCLYSKQHCWQSWKKWCLLWSKHKTGLLSIIKVSCSLKSGFLFCHAIHCIHRCHLVLLVPSAGIPWWLRPSSVCLQCGRPGFDSWVRKIPWRRKWQSTPALLPGKSHGRRSLIGYNPWGRKESDMTERLHFTLQELRFGSLLQKTSLSFGYCYCTEFNNAINLNR